MEDNWIAKRLADIGRWVVMRLTLVSQRHREPIYLPLAWLSCAPSKHPVCSPHPSFLLIDQYSLSISMKAKVAATDKIADWRIGAQPNFFEPPFVVVVALGSVLESAFKSLFFLPPLRSSRWPALAPRVRSVMAVRPAECFFVILAFLTSTAFRGAIVREPFLGPRMEGLCLFGLVLEVAVESFLDLSVPWAIFAAVFAIEVREVVVWRVVAT